MTPRVGSEGRGLRAHDLLEQQKIKPLAAQRFPLAEARQAQEMLGKGGVTGKIVLVCRGTPPGSAAA